MTLVKIPLKIMSVFIVIVLEMIYVLGGIVNRITAIGAGLIYSVIFVASIVTVFLQEWKVLLGLLAVGGVVFLLQFFADLIVEITKEGKDILLQFIRS